MEQMQTLTVNGQTFALRDSEAARLDDTATGKTTVWSSEKQAETFASAITGTASGPVISLRDISPLPHDLTVTVDGDATAVTRLGKNWFDGNWESGFLDTNTGAETSKISDCIRTGYIPVKPNTNYYFTLDSGNIYPVTYDQDKNFCRYLTLKVKSFWFTTADNEYFIRVAYYKPATPPVQAQLELGTAPTEYEPYIAPVSYPVAADGAVSGVTSVYPCTTLYTDTEGAAITVQYNKDTGKVIENLVQAIISLGGNV